MARYTGPVCRICRRESMKLFLKGEKCFTKCTFEKRSSPPGMHQQRRRKVSDFALQLREKQKARRMYGVLLREPFQPAAPADDHAITFPAGSLSEMIVLLNDALTCAAPRGTTRFSRRRRGAAFGSAACASPSGFSACFAGASPRAGRAGLSFSCFSCFGSEQITRICRSRRMILHLSQRFLTDARTFNA